MNSNDKRLSDLVAKADDQDLERARAAITEGVKTARDSWIPKHLVAQALVLELQACVVDEDSSAVVEFLRRMADTIEKPEKSKPKYH